MFFRGKHVRHQRIWQISTALVILLAVALILYPFLEPYRLEIERTALTLADLPEDTRQLTVVYLTDVHEGSFLGYNPARSAALVNKVNSLNADIVLLGGDYTGSVEESIAFFGRIPAVHAKYGVYAVMGEKDQIIRNEDLYAMRNAMKAKGVTLLRNAVQPVRIGQKNIYIAALDYLTEDAGSVIASISRQVSKTDFVILLCHTPEAIDAVLTAKDSGGRDGWFDTAFFGHTLGGQLPGNLNLFHIAEEVPAGHRQGWITENRTPMLISCGVGTAGVPVRIGCAPQIHVITIRNR